MKICTVKDINKAIDSVFNNASKRALSVNLVNPTTLQVDIKRAESNTIKRPDQAKVIAERIKKSVLDKFREAGFNDDFIKQFSNDIVRITDYSDSGIAIIKKVVSPRLVEFIETTADMMQTEEELFQEVKNLEAIANMETLREAEYQHAESMGITREEYDTFRQSNIDYSQVNPNSFNQESNTVTYNDVADNYFDALEDTARMFSAAPSPVQNFINTRFDNYVKFKKNQKYRLEKKLAQIKKLKKENFNNKEVLKQLSKAEENVREYLEGNPSKNTRGIIQDIEQIEQAKDVNRILYSAQNDIARVKYLSQSSNAENLAEAKEIISFYKAAADFSLSPNVDNPLFHGFDIANEYDSSNIPDSVKQAMKEIYEQLEPIEMLINNKEQQSIMQNLNNLEQIKSNPNLVNKKTGQITYNDIFFKDDGLKDITLAENYFYDPGTTFLRSNGVVPQAMQIMLENAYNDAHTYTKETVEKVDALLPRVTKVLRDMGYTSKVFGKSVGVDWDLFRAKDSNGLLRDGIVQRYSNEFLDAITEMKKSFQNKVRKTLDPSVDPKVRASALESIHKDRDKWLRENTLVIDPRKIPEITNTFSGPSVDDGGAHVAELKALLGEQGYIEEINKQITRIRNYETALELEKEKLASVSGAAYIAKLQQFENRNSPYIAAENYYNNTYPTRGVLVDYTNMKYSYMVPLNKNNFYDKNFEVIESNPDLKEFHNLMMDVIENIQENLTPELQSKLSTTSLPQLQKPLMEIFADPHLTLKAKMSEAYGRFIEFIRSLYSINPQSAVDNNLVDLVTGKRLDQVNASFLKGAKEDIDRRSIFAIDTFKKASGVSLAKKDKINLSWNGLNSAQIGVLQDILHPKQIIEMKNSPDKNFDIGKTITDAVTNDVISEGSFDLPKIAKLYTTLTMEFSARNQVLPSIKLMLEHYKLIRNPNTTQQGNSLINKITGKSSVKGERHNAINQIESWFNRVALGNYSKENEFGMTKSTERDLLNKEEKELKKKYEDLIKNVEEEIKNTEDSNLKSKLAKKRGYYESQIKLLGKKKSLSAFIDANFSFIRALGLGWNVSSQVTNLVEGQISNTVLGSSGSYYSPQNLERANNIVLGSMLKNASFGKLTTPGAKKASAIMHKFDVMQDATNELQKASNKNPLDNVNKFFAPFALISKVEYINQTPVVIAILMDQKITDIHGNESNVWDAMNPDGTLKEPFKTTENVENWENANGEQYKKFTSTVGQAISFQHGDYSKIRGMKASEEVSGKVILMFKRWATMWLQSRLALPHVSLRGKDHVLQKGRLRSHTKVTGALSGGIFGATVMSGAFTAIGVALPALLPVVGGAILGGYLAQKFGMNSNNKNNYKDVLGVDSIMKETALTMKLVAMKMIGVPANLVSGKQVIQHNQLFEGDKDATLAVDARNYRANISEIAIQLTLLGMASIVRGMWGDDPEDEKKYNLLSNRIGKLLKQTNMLFDVTDMHSLITDFAVIRYTQNILKFLQEFAKVFGTEDLEEMKSGPHKGELKVVKTFKSAFLPSLLRDKDPLTFGFGTDMDKFYDFNTIAIVGKAKHGTPDEKAKEELDKIKKELKKQYIDNVKGLTSKEKKDREKMINKLLVKPPKGSNLTVLENVQQYLDALSATYGEGGDPSLMEDLPSRREVEEQFEMEGDIYPEEEETTEEEDIFEEEENIEE